MYDVEAHWEGEALLMGGAENSWSDGDGYDKGKARRGKKIEAKQERLMRSNERCFPFLNTHLLSFSSLFFSFLPLG